MIGFSSRPETNYLGRALDRLESTVRTIDDAERSIRLQYDDLLDALYPNRENPSAELSPDDRRYASADTALFGAVSYIADQSDSAEPANFRAVHAGDFLYRMTDLDEESDGPTEHSFCTVPLSPADVETVSDLLSASAATPAEIPIERFKDIHLRVLPDVLPPEAYQGDFTQATITTTLADLAWFLHRSEPADINWHNLRRGLQ